MEREPFRYEKLQVWQRSMDLWVRLYKATANFPSDERFGLVSQIRRAAASIPANLAEGSGKGTDPAFVLHVRHARGSLFEVCTFIEGARRLGLVRESEALDILEELREISKMIDGLLKSLASTNVREQNAGYQFDQQELPQGDFLMLLDSRLQTSDY